MLSAVGNVVDKIQEVAGLKGDAEPDTPSDAQQAGDQGAGEASPEFTTTSKVTEPSGKQVLKTVRDDVPLPAGDTATGDQDAKPNTTKQQPKAPAAPAPAQATASTGDTPKVPACMNKLANRGGGAQALPSTPHKWKTQHDIWYPDAAGVLHPPNFHINKRKAVPWQ